MTEVDMELDWIRRWALYSPLNVSIKDAASQTQWTYQQLHGLVSQLADRLQSEYQIAKNDRVAVLSRNHWAYIPLFLAVQRLGAILVPLNVRLAPKEWDFILTDAAPKLMIFSFEYEEALSEIPELNIRYRWNFNGKNSLTEFLSRPVSVSSDLLFQGGPEDCCMILYTSGTTGFPKGAMINNRMLLWNSINTSLRLDLTQRDVHVSCMPFYHIGGWNVLLTPFLHKGAKTLVMEKFDADQMLAYVEREKATVLFAIPTMMDMMSKSKKFEETNLSSVRYAIVGGEPMPLSLIEIWEKKGIPIRQGYGLTEFGPNVFSLNEADSKRKIGSIGFPNFYVQTRVVNEHGEECKANEVGELLLKGPSCTPGYWQNEEATRSAIQKDWFHTGDLVRFDDEGYFYVVGRKKDMFISGGENVYPVEIETYLRTHPKVCDVAIVGVPDEKWGETGKAFLVLKPNETLSESEVMDFCQKGLAKFKVPKLVAFIKELPKGDSGKVLKRVLREQ